MQETGRILDPGTCSEIIRQFPQNGNKQTKKKRLNYPRNETPRKKKNCKKLMFHGVVTNVISCFMPLIGMQSQNAPKFYE